MVRAAVNTTLKINFWLSNNGRPLVVEPAKKKQAPVDWLRTPNWRLIILAIAACLSLPPTFSLPLDVGLDSSWQLSLQLAAAEHKVFGTEFVFTYGPLGYVLIGAPVSKLILLLYNLFVLGSLLSLYRRLLPERPRPLDAVLVIGLAVATKFCLTAGPSGVLFTILCYWLWRLYRDETLFALPFSLLSAFVLFYGKLNYGLIVLFVIPAYALALISLRREKRVAGMVLGLAFPLLLVCGNLILRVDLAAYLRAGIELIGGYNEAMSRPPSKTLLSFDFACVLLLAMGLVAIFRSGCVPWREQAVTLPLLALASALLFRNAFGRTDAGHIPSFVQGLPLILALWCVAWRREATIRALLMLSLLYPLTVFGAKVENLSSEKLFETLPLRYLQQAWIAPWSRDSVWLRDHLQLQYPNAVLPAAISSAFNHASTDVMPWEASIAVINGFKLKQRPVAQSYSAYTAWLDSLNARFLSSKNAPDYILYACAQDSTIDERPAAWDESISKRALLENYAFDSEFTLPLRVWPEQNLVPAPVFKLKRAGGHRLVPIASKDVDLGLNEALAIPTTNNLVFLTLSVERTAIGQIVSFLLWPKRLDVKFVYEDGTSKVFRAVLPILRSGVLINRRVESPDEIRNWLELATVKNLGISSVTFQSSSLHWMFRQPFKGRLVEYALE